MGQFDPVDKYAFSNLTYPVGTEKQQQQQLIPVHTA